MGINLAKSTLAGSLTTTNHPNNPMWFSKRATIDELDVSLPREELLRRSRILIVDDERPEIVDDLAKARFAVDYVADITPQNIDLVDRPVHDLIILDFGSVGEAFGPDEGLSLLRHIKRVNPSVIVLAYTSKALGTQHADFFRITDGVLPKDAGISETLDRIEAALQQAHSVKNIWRGLLTLANVVPGSEQDLEWQHLYVAAVKKNGKRRQFKEKVLSRINGETAQKVTFVLIEKLIEIGVKSLIGV